VATDVRQAGEDALFWREEAQNRIVELRDDLMRFYEPEKGWPPHIATVTDLGDYEEAALQLRAALAHAGPRR
jgi:hypothetical protein